MKKEEFEMIYQSKKFIEKQGTSTLRGMFKKYLKDHPFVRCKSLKNRKVFLDKLPEAIIKRKNCKNRMQAFWVGIDIVKNATVVSKKISGYEILGISADKKKIHIHLREELYKKDKKLFLISTYYGK